MMFSKSSPALSISSPLGDSVSDFDTAATDVQRIDAHAFGGARWRSQSEAEQDDEHTHTQMFHDRISSLDNRDDDDRRERHGYGNSLRNEEGEARQSSTIL